MEIVLKRLKNGLNSRFNKAGSNLNEMEKLITPIDNANKEFYQKRLDNLKKIYQTMKILINTIPDRI